MRNLPRWLLLLFMMNGTFCVAAIAKEALASDKKVIQKKNNRVQELLIWKISDRLELTSEQEGNLDKILKSSEEKRSSLKDKINELIMQLDKEKDEKKIVSLLSQYEKNSVELNRIREKEFSSVKNLLGARKMAQYISVRQELSDRVADWLIHGDNETKQNGNEQKIIEPKVIEPKVIEEKPAADK